MNPRTSSSRCLVVDPSLACPAGSLIDYKGKRYIVAVAKPTSIYAKSTAPQGSISIFPSGFKDITVLYREVPVADDQIDWKARALAAEAKIGAVIAAVKA